MHCPETKPMPLVVVLHSQSHLSYPASSMVSAVSLVTEISFVVTTMELYRAHPHSRGALALPLPKDLPLHLFDLSPRSVLALVLVMDVVVMVFVVQVHRLPILLVAPCATIPTNPQPMSYPAILPSYDSLPPPLVTLVLIHPSGLSVNVPLLPTVAVSTNMVFAKVAQVFGCSCVLRGILWIA